MKVFQIWRAGGDLGVSDEHLGTALSREDAEAFVAERVRARLGYDRFARNDDYIISEEYSVGATSPRHRVNNQQ